MKDFVEKTLEVAIKLPSASERVAKQASELTPEEKAIVDKELDESTGGVDREAPMPSGHVKVG